MSSIKYLHLDAESVVTEIRALYAAFPELTEDDELSLSALEGETDFFAIIERLLSEQRETATMAEAVKLREQSLKARRERYERKDDAMRHLIRKLMEAAHQDKVTLIEATLSITKPRQSVVVDDVEALPQGTFALVRQADKKVIGDLLKAGEDIPGARLATGEASLTVRAK